MRVTIKYGTESINKNLDAGTTVSFIKTSQNILVGLDAPEGTRLKAIDADGDELADNDALFDGDVIVLEASACKKA